MFTTLLAERQEVLIMRIETMKINGNDVEFKVTDLGYNYGNPVRNGTVVEISNEKGFCRLSDGDAGKVGLYAYHEKNKAFVAAAKAYLESLFPGMEMNYYFPDILKDGKMPSPPVLFMAGIGPSEDGKTLYIDSVSMDSYQFVTRWEHVWRYWTSYNLCANEGVKFFFDEIRGSGIPKVYKFKNPCGNVVIRVQDADLDSRISDEEYFEKLFELIDQLKGE